MAGLRSAEALRSHGFAGEIVMVGGESAMPYNRPPLSKRALTTDSPVESLAFRVPASLTDATWRLGTSVEAADLSARTLIAGTTHENWDGLVIATGARPRRLDVPGPTLGRHVIRTFDDITALRSELGRAGRLVVVGAGFIGCEVAASARTMGLHVDVVAPEAVPMLRPLGEVVGRELRSRHEAAGVRFHLQTAPVAFEGESSVETVLLSDGTELRADVVVEALGCTPNVEWLAGTQLDLTDGVLCDSHLRVEGLPNVVAAGDVARFPNAMYDSLPRRVEHWTMATDTARRAGATLAAHLSGVEPTAPAFAPMPSFWSDQYDMRLQSFGSIGLSTHVELLEGNLSSEFVMGYLDDSGLVGVVMIGMGGRAVHYRGLLAQRAATRRN